MHNSSRATVTAAEIQQLADLLNNDGIYDLVAGTLADLRDAHPRHPDSIDSGALVDGLIRTLRHVATELAA